MSMNLDQISLIMFRGSVFSVDCIVRSGDFVVRAEPSAESSE